MVRGIAVQSPAEMPGSNVQDLVKVQQVVKGISTRDPGTAPPLQIAV